MNGEQLQQLAANIAVLHQELRKQSMQALALQQEGIRQLEEQLKTVDRLVAEEVAHQLGLVSDTLKQEISDGGKKGLADFAGQIEDLKQQMLDFSKFAALAQKQLDTASRSVLLKIGYLSAFALICVVAAALWLGLHYSKIINDYKMTAENLQLYQQADIVKCGNHLCAKTKKNTPAEFRKQGYQLINEK